MVKLTDEDKAANKASQKIRDKAYSARTKGYRDARDAAGARIEASPEAKAVKDAMDVMDVSIKRNIQAKQEIQTQIMALRRKQDDIDAEFALSMEALRADRNRAWALQNTLTATEMAKVDLDFADVADVDWIAQWAIPEDVQRRMDEASQAARGVHEESGKT